MSEKISEEIAITLAALKRRGLDARFATNREAAKKIIMDMVPENWIVGCGDSATVRSLGVLQDLADMGNRILNPFVWPKIMREHPQPMSLRVMKQTSQGCDVFLSGSNAVTQDGKLVNVGGGGMRVTGMIFGPSLSIVIAGRNKIVKDVHAALDRIKNVLAPAHAKNIGWNCPCVAAGRCVEPEILCEPGQRICNFTVITEGKSGSIDLAVIIVDDDLGLGWDPAWPQERKDKILAEYQRFTPPHKPRKAP